MAKEEGIAALFWKKHEKESLAALYTPYFVCLAAGNLDLEIFQCCMLEDFKFLLDFDKGLEEIIPEKNVKVRFALGLLKDSVDEKITSYQADVESWGVELSEDSYISAEAAKYNQFFLEKIYEHTKIAAYRLAAIAPFMRLYAHLCPIMLMHLEDPEDTPHTYKKWLQYYSSHGIKEFVRQTEELLDLLSASFTAEELQVLEKFYHQAFKIRLEFFASLLISQPIILPLSRVQEKKSQLIICSNFDLTCSVANSSALLVKLHISPSTWYEQTQAYIKKVRWEYSLIQYAEKYQRWVENITSTGVPEATFDYYGLSEAVKRIAELVKYANKTVEDSGLLKGISLDGIKQAGQRVDLHKGCRQFFQKIVKKRNPRIGVHVISYCWSGELIRSAFSSDLQAVHIHSNEFAYKESITTGKINRKVETPEEKLQIFMNIPHGREKSSTRGKKQHLKVYIGQGMADLLCLLQADIGIVFGSSVSLRKLAKHFGVKFVPLHFVVAKKSMGLDHVCQPRCGILYTVGSWAEIEAFILDIGIVFDSSTSDLCKVCKYFGVEFLPLRCGVVKNHGGYGDWKLKPLFFGL